MSTNLVAFASWYSRRGAALKVAAGAIYWFCLLWIGAVVEREVQTFTTEFGWPTKPSYAVVLFACVLVLATAHYYFRLAVSAAEQKEQDQLETLMYAASVVDQCVADRIRQYSEMMKRAVDARNRTGVMDQTFAHVGDLDRIVKAVYQLFESRYGESKRIVDRIEFEVTFMTRSYRDAEITIPSYANRTGRAPRSLLERDRNPKLYDDTVTALCYRDTRPIVRVTEDTRESDYAEVYPGQKDRIRSSIVYPVLSHHNEILGTLVVHCDRPGFFLQRDARFWREVLEIFAKHLAFEKIRLDQVYAAPGVIEMLNLPSQEPPF